MFLLVLSKLTFRVTRMMFSWVFHGYLLERQGIQLRFGSKIIRISRQEQAGQLEVATRIATRFCRMLGTCVIRRATTCFARKHRLLLGYHGSWGFQKINRKRDKGSCLYIYVYTYIYLHIYMYTYVCIHVYIYVYLYLYINTYLYILYNRYIVLFEEIHFVQEFPTWRFTSRTGHQ